MKHVSLNYQINFRILLSALGVFLAGAIITIWQAKAAINKEIESSVNLTTHLIACGLSQKSPNEEAWLNCVSSLKESRHLTIALLKPNGNRIGGGQGEDGKPVLGEAPPSWFVMLAGGEKRQVNKFLTTSSGEEFTLSIQANPLDETTEAWQEMRDFFGIISLLVLLTFISVRLALKKSIKSINSIVQALQTVETGRYQDKLPEFETTEFNSIAKAINHMTGELSQSQRENRALTQHSLEILENERKQLAQELHDELGQSLTAIKMMAVTANRKPSEIGAMTEAIAQLCDDLIKILRHLMYQLHPLVLTELGLKAALEDLISHWTGKHPALKLTLACNENIDVIGQNKAIQIFRIVQEGLTNIMRHSQAAEAAVDLAIHEEAERHIRLAVRDNGQGCLSEQLKKGFGLLGMKERVQSLEGDLSIETKPGQGFIVQVKIPLQRG